VQVKSRLAGNPVPIQMPVGAGDDFSGIIDLIKMKYMTFEGEKGEDQVENDIPANLKAEAEKRRIGMMDAVASYCGDDEIETAYLDNGTLSNEQIMKGLLKGCMAFKLQPMLCGAALRNKGIQMLLDAVVDILPNPRDAHAIKQYDVDDILKTKPIPTICDPKLPLRAMVCFVRACVPRHY
jgi:elongation factor G